MIPRCTIRLEEFELWEAPEHVPLTLYRSVRAPLCTVIRGRKPRWTHATVDPGGTRLFGPGPYLHLPYGGGDLDDEFVTRVRCPYGYPGARTDLTLLSDAPPAWWCQQEVYPSLTRARFGFLTLDQQVRVTHVALRPTLPAPPPARRYGPWTWAVTLVRA